MSRIRTLIRTRLFVKEVFRKKKHRGGIERYGEGVRGGCMVIVPPKATCPTNPGESLSSQRYGAQLQVARVSGLLESILNLLCSITEVFSSSNRAKRLPKAGGFQRVQTKSGLEHSRSSMQSYLGLAYYDARGGFKSNSRGGL